MVIAIALELHRLPRELLATANNDDLAELVAWWELEEERRARREKRQQIEQFAPKDAPISFVDKKPRGPKKARGA